MNPRLLSSSTRVVWTIAVVAAFLVCLSARGTQVGLEYFSSSAAVINFDNLAGGSSLGTGEIVTTQYAGLGVVFNDPDYPARANLSIGQQLLSSNSLPNMLFVLQHDGFGSSGRPLQILFSTP